jgi:hypothetical protein
MNAEQHEEQLCSIIITGRGTEVHIETSFIKDDATLTAVALAAVMATRTAIDTLRSSGIEPIVKAVVSTTAGDTELT